MGVLARLACNVVGNVIPTYQSYQAVLNSSPEEHKQWLTYWLAFTAFTILETFGDALVSWVPLYWEAKVVCLGWLSLCGGAATVYNVFVRAFLEKYEAVIDSRVGQIQAAAAKGVNGVAAQGRETLRLQGASIAATGLQWLAAANNAVARPARAE